MQNREGSSRHILKNMRSKQVSPEVSRRGIHFEHNRQATQIIRKALSSPLNQTPSPIKLQIQSVDDEHLPHRVNEPLLYSNAIEIDVKNIALPLEGGSVSLKDYLTEFCQLNKIVYPADMTAEFRTTVALLPGKHYLEDTECTKPAYANFFPVFSNSRRTNVVALVYTLDSVEPLRMDHMTAVKNMLCNNRNAGVSSYMMATQDKITSVVVAFIEYQEESIALKKVTDITVFALEPYIQNENKFMSQAECENIIELMHARVADIHKLYLPEVSDYERFMQEIDAHLNKFAVSSRDTSILEKTFCTIAAINKFDSARLDIAKPAGTATHLRLELALTDTSCLELISKLHTAFGPGFCQVAGIQQNKNYIIEFPFNKLFEYLTVIKVQMTHVLNDKRNLVAYQKYTQQQKSLHFEFYERIARMFDKYQVDFQKTKVIEAILIRMFPDCSRKYRGNYKDHCSPGTLFLPQLVQPGTNEIDNMLSTYFFLEMPAAGAQQLVANINYIFPDQASYMGAGARLASSAKTYSIISIENTLLVEEEFISAFHMMLDNIMADEPELYLDKPCEVTPPRQPPGLFNVQRQTISESVNRNNGFNNCTIS